MKCSLNTSLKVSLIAFSCTSEYNTIRPLIDIQGVSELAGG